MKTNLQNALVVRDGNVSSSEILEALRTSLLDRISLVSRVAVSFLITTLGKMGSLVGDFLKAKSKQPVVKQACKGQKKQGSLTTMLSPLCRS